MVRVGEIYPPETVKHWEIAGGEWVRVAAGWVALINSAVLIVDGVLRLDGVVKVL